MNINANEIITDVATNLVEDSIKGAWSKVKKFFKDMEVKDEIRYGEAYEEYLINTKNKYRKIKTLIYRHAPKELYSFYECIGVYYNGSILDTSNINNLISKEKKIVITGSGGMGKSILLKHLFLNAIEETGYIPVLIELRSMNSFDEKNISIKGMVYDMLVQNGFTLEEEYFEYSLTEGGYVILLDGLDEVNRDRLSRATTEIRKFSDKYRNNKYIVSSRPSDNFIGWNDYAEMSSVELNKKQALELINKIEFDENVKKVFYKELDAKLYDRYRSFASNPLLLNIMLLTFNNNASIPDKLNDFYELAFSTLYNMHDATKESYVRDIRTGLSCEDFKILFAYMCFKSYFRDEYEFSEVKLRNYIQEAKEKYGKAPFTVDEFLEDLTMSVCMLVKDGLNYRFVHRSFQEYFAAWYTCKLTDDIQQKLLSNWLKESNTVDADSYFSMLFNMQSEKVNKIIFAPGIKDIKQKVDEEGYSFDLLKYLFKGISVRKSIKNRGGKKEASYGLSLWIKERYYCTILMMACRLNGYTYYEVNKSTNEEVARESSKCKKENSVIPFDEVISIVGEDTLYDALEWFKRQLEFAFGVLEKCENSSIGRKKRVSSILDEL